MGIIAGLVAVLGLSLCFTALLWSRGVVASSGAIYQGSTGEKAVAITVNVDWGAEHIPAMLEALQKNQAKATFFVTGTWAENNPELLKAMDGAGHSIQNHGYQHIHFNRLKAAQVQEQIKQAEEVIFQATGKQTRFFAPPYGEKNPSLIAAVNTLGYEYILWSIDTIDWEKPAPQVIVERVMKRVHNDAIILMHPTEPTVIALPEILAGLNEQGYKMLTIEELVQAPAEGQ
ncbi:MAG: polysaccharide deacetylase family protein [Syntrophomonadaceae bacterium]|nr:polysaccharide deacetylase family protein [Syntrophomonadaceae bacterium]